MGQPRSLETYVSSAPVKRSRNLDDVDKFNSAEGNIVDVERFIRPNPAAAVVEVSESGGPRATIKNLPEQVEKLDISEKNNDAEKTSSLQEIVKGPPWVYAVPYDTLRHVNDLEAFLFQCFGDDLPSPFRIQVRSHSPLIM